VLQKRISPKALNALNSEVLNDLGAALDGVDLDTIRCLILTGAGEKSFVAGADIGEMYELDIPGGEAFARKGNDLFLRIESFPIPIIAAVNGFALGGGNEISMACDSWPRRSPPMPRSLSANARRLSTRACRSASRKARILKSNISASASRPTTRRKAWARSLRRGKRRTSPITKTQLR